jgi:hypothetical protein
MHKPEDASLPAPLKPICLRFAVKSMSACLTTTVGMEFRGSGGNLLCLRDDAKWRQDRSELLSRVVAFERPEARLLVMPCW